MKIQERTNSLINKLNVENKPFNITSDESEFLYWLLLHIVGIDHKEVTDRLQDGKQDYFNRTPIAWRWRNIMGDGNSWTYSTEKPEEHDQYITEPLYN